MGGHTVWMDNQLITGQSWRDQLETQIKQSDAIALALTPNWVASPYCNWEFIIAVENDKKVIPVLLEKASLPDRIRQYQYADLSGGFDEAAVQRLQNDLLQLAVTVDDNAIKDMDRESFAMSINRQNEQGNNVKLSGSSNTIAGGNIDQSQHNISIGGNVSGSNVNIGGNQTVYGNVTIGSGKITDVADERDQLETLIKQLNAELKQIPQDDAAVIEALAQDAINEASKGAPNRRLLEIKGESLKQAAENILAVSPIIAKIVARLLSAV